MLNDLECELCEDEWYPGLGEQVGQAGVPARVELEPAVQGSHQVWGQVPGARHIVLVQLRGLERVPHLQSYFCSLVQYLNLISRTNENKIGTKYNFFKCNKTIIETFNDRKINFVQKNVNVKLLL